MGWELRIAIKFTTSDAHVSIRVPDLSSSSSTAWEAADDDSGILGFQTPM